MAMSSSGNNFITLFNFGHQPDFNYDDDDVAQNSKGTSD